MGVDVVGEECFKREKVGRVVESEKCIRDDAH